MHKALGYTAMAAVSMLLGSVVTSYAQYENEFDGTEQRLPENQCYCNIFYIDKPILAAGESGILKEILAEGTAVSKDDTVASTDSSDAMLRREAAWYTWQATEMDISSDIRERYARAQFEASRAAYRQVLDANKRSPKAISQAELDKRELDMKAAELGIENAAHERNVSKISVKKEHAEFKLAEQMALRHQIKSPIDGVVVERLKEVGEFVQAGEEVIQVVRLDRLRAVGQVPISYLSPVDAKGKEVDVSVAIGDAEYHARGTIYHSDTAVGAGEHYQAWVQFDNPSGLPFRPGMRGILTFNN